MMVCLGLLVMMTVSVFHHVHNLVKLLLMAAVCLVTALALAPASCGHLASLPLAVSLLHLLNRAADYKARLARVSIVAYSRLDSVQCGNFGILQTLNPYPHSSTFASPEFMLLIV